MFEFPFGVACGANEFLQFMPKMNFWRRKSDSGWKMIHFGGRNVSGRLKYDFFIFLGSFWPVTIGVYLFNFCYYRRIFVQFLSLSTYICQIPLTIGVYLSNACHYWRILVQCLSLSAYTCPMPVTIGVYLSNACHYRRIFLQCLSLSAYICPVPLTIGVYLSIACHYRRIFVHRPD